MSDNRRFNRFVKPGGSALQQVDESNSLAAADQEIFGSGLIVPRQGVPEAALVKRADGALQYKQFVLHPTRLDIPDGTDGPAWQDVGDMLRNLESAVSWWVADWAAYARRVWKWDAAAIAEAFGYEVSTIEPYMSVADSIPGLIRNQAVSFSHHRRVAKLDAALQERWLTFAARRGLTLEAFKREMLAIQYLTYAGKIEKLDMALAQNVLITDLPGVKRPTPPAADRVQKQVSHYATYVKTEQDNIPYMRPDQREAFLERAQWLSEYYRKLALRALGEED